DGLSPLHVGRVWRRGAVSVQPPILGPISHRLHHRRVRSVPVRCIHSRNRAPAEAAHAPFPRGLEYPVCHPHSDALLHVQESCGPSQSPAFRDCEGRGIPGTRGRSGAAYRLLLPACPFAAGLGDISVSGADAPVVPPSTLTPAGLGTRILVSDQPEVPANP